MRGFQPAGDKALKKNSTGPVRGPGSGTSDDVQTQVQHGTYIMPTDSTQAIGEQQLAAMGKGNPVDVNLSNGEFKLPPEQVHAIGVQALGQMKDATHTPVAARGFAPGAQQQAEPPLFFADGGVVDDERRKPNVPSPSNIFPGNRLQGDSGFSGTTAPAVPAQQGMAGTQRAAATNQIPTRGVASPPPAAQAATRPGDRPLDAQAASDRAKFGAAWDTVKDVNDSAGRAIADVATMVPRGLAGAYDSAVVRPMRAAGFDASYLSPSLVPDGVDPSSMTPFTDQKRMREQAGAAAPSSTTAAAAAAPAVAPSAPSTAGAGRGFINPPRVNPAAPVPTSSQPGAAQISPGVFRSGNSYSDSAAGAVAGAQPRGLPSAQNMAAADALALRDAARSAAAGQSPAAPQVAGFQAPVARSSQNDWQMRNTLRNAEVGASSIMNTRRWGGKGAENNPSALAYQAMLKNDLALQGAQPGLDAAAMRENAATQRTGMAQQGANQRSLARAALEQQKIDQAGVTQGIANRGKSIVQALQAQIATEQDPAKRQTIVERLRQMQGGQTADPYLVVPGGQQVDETGRAYTMPSSVFNRQTGQFVSQVGGALPPIEQNPQAIAISSNQGLSREQKVEALRKLGYQG